MARTTDYKRILHKVTSVVLAILFALGTIPPVALDVVAADATFNSGAVYLDESYSGKEIIIQNGVFSVTVNGATNITIIFDGVTIDRRASQDKDAKVTGLREVGTNLGAANVAQTCPFLITGNAEVTAQFRGKCVRSEERRVGKEV